MNKVWLPTLIVVAAMAIGIWFYPQLPEQIPSAFADNGKPSSVASKAVVLGTLYLNLIVLYIVLLVVPRVSRFFKNSRFRKPFNTIMLFVLLVYVALLGTVIAAGMGYVTDILRVIPAIVGMALLVVGNVVQRFKHDTTSGMPISDALLDMWNKIRRIVAKVLFSGGFLLLLCVFLPSGWILTVFFTLLGGTLLAAAIGSYFVYTKHYRNIPRQGSGGN